MKRKLIFLKLGGSVITHKDQPNSADFEMLDAIAKEIARAQNDNTALSLLIGHGSGSFGHQAAEKYNTRNGVKTFAQWKGFTEVAMRARQLNQIVIERLLLANVNVLSISPFSGIVSQNRKVLSWDISIIEKTLQNQLVPVIYGDVILDEKAGGVIFSTEELFSFLACKLHPDRILLAGLEEGVWQDYPKNTILLPQITPWDIQKVRADLQVSQSIDVTGGMRSKVEDMVSLIQQLPSIEVQIFSAREPGNVYSSLMGVHKGTVIRNSKG